MDSNTFDPPLFVGNFFEAQEGNSVADDAAEEREHVIAGQRLRIREYAFSPTNANFVWPNNEALASWILEHADMFRGRRILELGSATGALYCALVRCGFDITSSDAPDPDITRNLRHNCEANSVAFRHIEHGWGEAWPAAERFDVVIASDILLYSRLYPALVRSLRAILTATPASPDAAYPVFVLSARRRVPEDSQFFDELQREGFICRDHGKRLYTITIRAAHTGAPHDNNNNKQEEQHN